MVLVPALRLTVMLDCCQFSHVPVLPKFTVWAEPPLTVTLIGRAVVVPLAKPNVSVLLPADDAWIVHSTKLPTSLALLTNPAPENPGWSESTVPWKIVAFSASCRPAGGLPPPAYADPIHASSTRSRLP